MRRPMMHDEAVATLYYRSTCRCWLGAVCSNQTNFAEDEPKENAKRISLHNWFPTSSSVLLLCSRLFLNQSPRFCTALLCIVPQLHIHCECERHLSWPDNGNTAHQSVPVIMLIIKIHCGALDRERNDCNIAIRSLARDVTPLRILPLPQSRVFIQTNPIRSRPEFHVVCAAAL